MPASASDYFNKVGTPGSATFLASPGHTIGGTSFTVDSTSLWSTDTAVTFGIDTTSLVNGVVTRDTGSYTVWRGVVSSGTTITSCVLVYGTDQNYSAGTTTRVYILPTTSRENRIVDGLLVEHLNTGVHSTALITSRTEDTAPDIGADYLLSYDTSATAFKKVLPKNLGLSTGWVAGQLPAVSSVTENGNRSADITFASTVASILTPGMRIRTSRTVAAPTYMGGAFNGTNHYFTKVTCTSTLSTVTDNFTIMGWVEPTSYALGWICGRSDATPNNALGLKMNADGTVTCSVFSGGSANFRQLSTYQSIPLNKKTHVAASWASGTVVIYLDGISVPVSAPSTGGTAPTTAGTGGDFSIGRLGAFNSQYFPGYISGCGVFNAVLSAATIRSYKNQVLSGSETNCIGAWSLNNTGVNQQAAGTNDLTATNSVGYTSGRSPYTMDANGVAAGTYDYAIVTKVATTVATVQYPEGCGIATSGGISTVDYSGVKAPFGMPIIKSRWWVEAINKTDLNLGAATAGQYYFANLQITQPVGEFEHKHLVLVRADAGAAALRGVAAAISTASGNSTTELDLIQSTALVNASVTSGGMYINGAKNLSSATVYYLNVATHNTAATSLYHIGGSPNQSLLRLEPSHL